MVPAFKPILTYHLKPFAREGEKKCGPIDNNNEQSRRRSGDHASGIKCECRATNSNSSCTMASDETAFQ
jgi:hypothetical protein